MDELVVPLDLLLSTSNDQNPIRNNGNETIRVPTIGIGDGGNELGFMIIFFCLIDVEKRERVVIDDFSISFKHFG